MRTSSWLVFVVLSVIGCSTVWGIVFTSDTLIAADNTLYDGQAVTVNGCTVTINGEHSFASLSLINGGVVTHDVANGNGLQLDITGNVQIDFISAIDVSGKGYGADTGPGKGAGVGNYASGAGYGGLGGMSRDGAPSGLTYGSITEPVHFGSGGGTGYGSGGRGGGAVYLNIDGDLTVDGEIRAHGSGATAYYGGGGGSGGSILIRTAKLMGAGVIAANGGHGHVGNNRAGGGSGGRIAVRYDEDEFWGSYYCHGGAGFEFGGAGTLYLKASDDPHGQLIVDNWHQDGQTTPFTQNDTFSQIIAQNFGKVEISEADKVIVVEELTVLDEGFVLLHTRQVLPRVHVHSGGQVGHLPVRSGFELIVTGDVLVDEDGAISAEGKGYAAAEGPGKGATAGNYGSGGGYGGTGGNSRDGAVGGRTYGPSIEPLYFGSGGGNGYGSGAAGGGTIYMTVYGTVTVNGRLDANGAAATDYYGGGGGSGGSVYVKANVLDGTGVIAAQGGAGHPQSTRAGGGGGGRMDIRTGTTNFLGVISVVGGPGFEEGDDGTIHYDTFTFGCGDVLHPYPMADLSHDCIVDMADVAILAAHWLECTLDTCP